MRTNTALETLRNGGEVVSGWLVTNSTLNAEFMAHRGFDALTVDMQHGTADYSDLLAMLQAISTTSTIPLVRTPLRDGSLLGRILDAGAYGVICPMVNNREDAEAFVADCRYHPRGRRSCGPIRASIYGGADYFDHANDQIMTLAMIESKEAVDNIDDILDTPDLDGVFIGPSDLSVSMGYKPGYDPRHADVYEAITLVAARCKEKGKIPGIHTGSVAYAQEMRELGFRFMAYLSDLRMLEEYATPALKAFRTGKPVPGIA